MGASTDLGLVDHHCHGVLREPLDERALARWSSESDLPPARGLSHIDAPLGLAIRAWCAPVLDLPAHVSTERYAARRLELGAEETARRLLRATGSVELFVDTGIEGLDLTGPDELAELSGARAHTVVRIETIAAAVAREQPAPAAYADTFEQALRAAAADAVGLKSILAYRTGLELEPSPPDPAEVRRAVDRWLAAGPTRLEDPVLLRAALWTAIEVAREHGLPIQFHTGLGDTDIARIDAADPARLTPLIRRLVPLEVDVVLLHGYPYHRNAAYLAAMFPNVYLDAGLALNHAAGGATRVLAVVMVIVPFGKHLYSSDAVALPELYHLGARLFRRALDAVIDEWIASGLADAHAAERIARAVAHDNARRLYGVAAP